MTQILGIAIKERHVIRPVLISSQDFLTTSDALYKLFKFLSQNKLI